MVLTPSVELMERLAKAQVIVRNEWFIEEHTGRLTRCPDRPYRQRAMRDREIWRGVLGLENQIEAQWALREAARRFT